MALTFGLPLRLFHGAAIALLALGLIGCEPPAATPPPDPVEPEPAAADEPDHEMEQAMARARREVDRFIVALATPTEARTSEPMLKAPIQTPYGTLHVWLGDVEYENGTFTGMVVEQPLEGVEASPGDRITVRREQISDWLYTENDTLVGGYTLRVLYSRMSEDEQRQMRQMLPIE